MPEINNVRDAIKLAKEVMQEAGYLLPRIADVSFDEDDEVWKVNAYEGETIISIEIDDDGNVVKFDTEA